MFPLMVGGFPWRSMAATSPLYMNPCTPGDRSVVIIFLNGANDVINTAVPLNQFSAYTNHRPSIYLPESSLITLDSNLSDNQSLGLHPRLDPFKNLYDDGLLAMVQRVGYDQPNRSHFKSTENWLTGSGGNLPNLKDGWMARFLNNRFPGYQGTPFEGEPDPLGLLFGNTISTGFHSSEEHRLEINLSGQDPAGFYTLISSLGGAPIPNIPATDQGELLSYLETISGSVNVYAERISHTFNQGSNTANYPNSSLANQLKTIARMLSGGSRTKLFMASIGGWDNHNYINNVGATTEGRHADLLGDLSSSVGAFQNDLSAMGLDNNVLTVIFSEFGRKVIQNGSQGTDHGTLSTMFLVGKGVEGGVYGNNIDLNDQDAPGAPNPSQLEFDYRSVFASVLQDWLGADDGALQSTFINPQNYANKPALINTNNLVPSECYFSPQVPTSCACIQVKILLEGYYSNEAQQMTTSLLDYNLLPTSQPFGQAPFNYAGTESVASWPEDTVDWVLVELRSATNLQEVVARKAVLLSQEGLLMDTDGNKGISFENVVDGLYHLAIFHTNHLAVLSADPIPTGLSSFIYDFTTSAEKAEGFEQQKDLGGLYGLYAGDIDQNQIINNQDFNSWQSNLQNVPAYNANDLTADGLVNNEDYDLWLANRSKLGQLK